MRVIRGFPPLYLPVVRGGRPANNPTPHVLKEDTGIANALSITQEPVFTPGASGDIIVGQMEKYLGNTPAIDCDNESVKGKAADLTEDQEEVIDRAINLFYFVRDEIKYNPYLLSAHIEDYRASKVLRTGQGWCVQKAVLLAALARAVGIPARLHFADIRNHLLPAKQEELMGTNLFSYHGYTDLYIGGKWVKATPAFDLRLCQENRIIPVEFDGKNNAVFHSHNLDGELHIEHIQDHGHYEDIPLDEMLTAWVEVYGLESREQLSQLLDAASANRKPEPWR